MYRTVNGVIVALKITDWREWNNLSILVRLQGTNAGEAKQIIDNSGLDVISAVLLKEAAEEVSKVLVV